MPECKLYQALAGAFAAEGVRAQFTLMGDGNMHWVTSLAEEHGVRTIHARHENCAAAMAMGYARATRDVGVASVTMGPGFTQIATSLTSAARGNVPLVVFAGDIPTTSRWYHQRFEQPPLSAATGAHHIAVRAVDRALECVREAFYVARFERRPVVLSVPLDLQKTKVARKDYAPSSDVIPRLEPQEPDPAAIEEAVTAILQARRPIMIAGRGAMWSNARAEIETVAEQCGALLATTLHARGLFGDHEFSLGIAGGFSHDAARALFAECDLVLAFGASLGHYTSDGGTLYPNAAVVQFDTRPRGLNQGLRVADIHVAGDARLAARALAERLSSEPKRPGLRTAATRERIRSYSDDAAFPSEPGTLDPRVAAAALNETIPNDWAIVGASGHSFYFTATQFAGRSPHDFFSFKDFGEIGSHLSYAIGVAVARGDGKAAVIDGDGSLIMHIQELETISRHGIRLLVVALNDGAYGAELHKLRKEKHHPAHAEFGRPDFAAIAHAFGLRGATITARSQFEPAFAAHADGDRAEMWNVHIDRNVIGPHYRRKHGIESAMPATVDNKASAAAAEPVG
jgi:thiamine pyrophosphate-dependent acetolactate synthase large subunit-like protein